MASKINGGANWKYVAYHRVSTKKQGQSGLGLEAQKTAVAHYLAGGPYQLVGEFTEIESGKDHKNRPKLLEALAFCRVTGARLIVATLDRLSRDVEFLAKLQKSSVQFLCADMPEANELTINVLAAVAQAERKRISERIVKTLAEARRRGTKLGAPKGERRIAQYHADRGRKRAINTITSNANRFARDLAQIIESIRAAGITTQQKIAEELNRQGIPTRRGLEGRWSQVSVGLLLKRLKAIHRRDALAKSRQHDDDAEEGTS